MDSLQSQLHKLQSIQPDKDWKLNQKETLLKQIAGSTVQDKKINYFFLYVKEAFAYEKAFLAQPIVSMAIVLMLIISGAFFSITAASEATPGSFLYTVKLVSEKTQFALTTKPEDKVKLGVTFVERRVDEISSVASESDDDSKVLSQITDNLTNGIISVQDGLAKIEDNDPASALRLARDIDQKTIELRNKLVSAKNMLSTANEEAAKQLNDAIEGVDAANLKALNTIVKASQLSQNHEDDSDVNSRMASKIENTKDKINALQENLNTVFSAGLGRSEQGVEIYDMNAQKQQADAKAMEAGKAIEEAQKLLEDNNYTEALAKITESENLIKEASEVSNTVEATEHVNDTDNSNDDVTVENQSSTTPEESSTTPEVKGVMEEADSPEAQDINDINEQTHNEENGNSTTTNDNSGY